MVCLWLLFIKVEKDRSNTLCEFNSGGDEICVRWFSSLSMKSSFVVNRTKIMLFVFGNTMFFVVQPWHRINNVKSIEMIEMIEMIRCCSHDQRYSHDQTGSRCYSHDQRWFCTALMREMTREPCARAWQCVEKSLLCDALAWQLQWSRWSHPKASSAHCICTKSMTATLHFEKSKIRTSGKIRAPTSKIRKN